MSKFGAHIVPGSRNGYGDFCAGKPAVVLSVDDGGALVEAGQRSGGYTLTIFRQTDVYLEAPEDFNTYPDMVALARYWYPKLKAKWQQNPGGDYYTITNEIGGNDEAVLMRLVAYEREIMRLANADGFKVCVLNLAGGSPGDIEVWKRVCLPFIVEAWAGRNIYGRHCYGGGDLVNPDGSVITGNPSRPFEEVGYLRAAGAAGGIVITECGLDSGFGFAGVERFTRQLTGYEKLLRPYSEFIGCCAWTTGNWSEANWQDAMPTMTQYLIDNPTPKWEWPSGTVPPVDPPTPIPPPSTYLHTRLIKPANIRRDPSTNSPAITPGAVKEGLELTKVADVTGQSVGGNNAWIKAAAFLSRSYVTDSGGGRVKTNRSVNLRIVPTVSNNWPIVTVPAGVEFESLGNVKDESNSGAWTAVALYVWRPLAVDVEPGIRLGSPLKIPLTITSPFGSPRNYPFSPNKKQLHEGLDWHTGGAIPVLAMEAGVVDFIRPSDPGYGYGLTVRIKHNDRYTSWYGHLSQIQVTTGQTVTKGQQIALSGRSGGSVHHLHTTLQDVPSGLDGYVIDNVCDFTLLMHPAVSLPNTAPPVPEPGNLIDLRRFKIADPDCFRVVRMPDGRQEDVQDMQLGNGLYVRRKNALAEWHRVDGNFFYLVHDTSPDVGSEGIPRVYTLYKNNAPGAPKSKIHQAVGETWQESGTHRVQFRAKSDCRLLAENSGNATNSSVITRYERNFRFNTYGQNLIFDEVIWEKTGQETQIYGRINGRSAGWIGWVAPWGQSEPVEIYFDRGKLSIEPNRYCGW